MVTRITAEFKSPEAAGSALGRIRGSVKGVYSASLSYSRVSGSIEPASRRTPYDGVRTASAQNCLTAVLTSPVAGDILTASHHDRRTKVYIVCDGSRTREISSILTAMGGSSIDSPAE